MKFIDEYGTTYAVRKATTGDKKGKYLIYDCLKGKKRWKPVPARRLMDGMEGTSVFLWSADKEKMELTLRGIAKKKEWQEVTEDEN